jgi:hypothetical protein
MLPRSAIALPLLLALMVTSPWNCSSHEAIVLLQPADAGPEAGATTSPDAPTSAPTDMTTSPPTDTRQPSDGPTSPPPDTRPPSDVTTSPPTDATTSPPVDTTTSGGLPFLDDFSGGWAANWEFSASADGPVSDSFDGSNAIVTFDATDYNYSRLRANRDGRRFADTDITASMRFRVDQAPTSTRLVRLDVRQAKNTENIFYAVGTKVDKDGSITKVGIYKKVDKNVEAGEREYTICSLAERTLTTPVPMGQWRTIKLTVSGTSIVSLTAFFEGQEMARYVDGCVSDLEATDGAKVPNGGCLADQTGIGIQVEAGIKASVDDVLVTAP